ncbi:MAG: carbohydrate-binding domain-containing protein, partial [Oscillospiraceae bacterium]|nr:carbohydrate-binding domain-containing protein [Oscillospiraceae bacterium]
INGGTVSVDSHSDGMQAVRAVTINGGDVTIHTYEGKDYKASGSNPGNNPGTDPGNGWTFPGWGGDNPGGWGGDNPGGWGGNPGGGGGFSFWDDSGHDLGLDFSAKGIKAGNSDAQIGGTISISGGTLTVDATDDAIHCGDTLTVSAGTLTVASADDALHCDKNLNITGGKITVTDSYEGIEASKICVKDGDMTIYAYDDAFNAGEKGAQKTVHVGNDNCVLQIDGGTIHAYVTNDAEGDTLDSNGKIIINGGTVYAEGSVNGPDSAMDSDGEMLVNGGTLVAIGGLGLGEMPVDASKQCSLYWGDNSKTYQSGSVIALLDASGKELLSYTAEQAFKCAIVSTADVRIGGSYTLTVNGNKVAEFNVSSALTKQGDVGSFGFGGW